MGISKKNLKSAFGILKEFIESEELGKFLTEEGDADDFRHSEDAIKAREERVARRKAAQEKKKGEYYVNFWVYADPSHTGSEAERTDTEEEKYFTTPEEANEYLSKTLKDFCAKYSLNPSDVKKEDVKIDYNFDTIDVIDPKFYSIKRVWLEDPRRPESIRSAEATWYTYRAVQKGTVDLEKTPANQGGERGEYGSSIDQEDFVAQAKKDFADYAKMSPAELNKVLYDDEFEKFYEDKLAANPDIVKIGEKPLPPLTPEEKAKCRNKRDIMKVQMEKAKNLSAEDAKTYRTFEEQEKYRKFLDGIRKEWDDMDN